MPEELVEKLDGNKPFHSIIRLMLQLGYMEQITPTLKKRNDNAVKTY